MADAPNSEVQKAVNNFHGKIVTAYAELAMDLKLSAADPAERRSGMIATTAILGMHLCHLHSGSVPDYQTLAYTAKFDDETFGDVFSPGYYRMTIGRLSDAEAETAEEGLTFIDERESR